MAVTRTIGPDRSGASRADGTRRQAPPAGLECIGSYRMKRAITGRWSEGAVMPLREAGSALMLRTPSMATASVLSSTPIKASETKIWSMSSGTPLLMRDQLAGSSPDLRRFQGYPRASPEPSSTACRRRHGRAGEAAGAELGSGRYRRNLGGGRRLRCVVEVTAHQNPPTWTGTLKQARRPRPGSRSLILPWNESLRPTRCGQASLRSTS